MKAHFGGDLIATTSVDDFGNANVELMGCVVVGTFDVDGSVVIRFTCISFTFGKVGDKNVLVKNAGSMVEYMKVLLLFVVAVVVVWLLTAVGFVCNSGGKTDCFGLTMFVEVMVDVTTSGTWAVMLVGVVVVDTCIADCAVGVTLGNIGTVTLTGLLS